MGMKRGHIVFASNSGGEILTALMTNKPVSTSMLQCMLNVFCPMGKIDGRYSIGTSTHWWKPN
jgi:hypothetical protein